LIIDQVLKILRKAGWNIKFLLPNCNCWGELNQMSK